MVARDTIVLVPPSLESLSRRGVIDAVDGRVVGVAVSVVGAVVKSMERVLQTFVVGIASILWYVS